LNDHPTPGRGLQKRRFLIKHSIRERIGIKEPASPYPFSSS
jgi:hypothetical protein